MDGRYEVFATHGKGVFSTVLRARDRGAPDASGRCPEVAVKVIRANDIMYKASGCCAAAPMCLVLACAAAMQVHLAPTR